MEIEDNLNEGEEIIATLNDHWIVLLKPIFGVILGWLAFFAVYALGRNIEKNLPEIGQIILIIGYIMLLMFTHWSIFYIFRWHISSWYITTERIIIFDLLPFVKHDLLFINIKEIHEVEETQHGIWANIFNYGTLLINLAAKNKTIEVPYAYEPSKTLSLINTVKSGKIGTEISIKSLQDIYHRKFKKMIN